MPSPEPSPEPPWPSPGAEEADVPEPVSPFLDPRLQLGAHSLPIPERTDVNPISLQVASASSRELLAATPAIASIVQRGAAKVADWFLTGITYVLVVAFWLSPMPWEERAGAISLALVFVLPAFWATWFLYNVLLNGRTLGKRLFGLEVVTDTWHRLSPGRNFGRTWAESLSWGFCYIGYLFALFDPAKRTMHDHLCGTRVILRNRTR